MPSTRSLISVKFLCAIVIQIIIVLINTGLIELEKYSCSDLLQVMNLWFKVYCACVHVHTAYTVHLSLYKGFCDVRPESNLILKSKDNCHVSTKNMTSV